MPSRRRLPPWAVYPGATTVAFIILIAADWARYAVTGDWIDWPWVAVTAVLWPIVMTAIT